MQDLFVLFDEKCELCRRCKDWLQTQKQRLFLTFIPATSAEARSLFPDLNHEMTLNELTVIGDNGAVYHGTKAWLMCLWALEDYRSWSYRLSTPESMPMAKRIITAISENRTAINKLLQP